MVLSCVSSLWTDWNLWHGIVWTSYLAFEQHWFWKVYEFLRDETLGDSLHGGHWSVLRLLDAVLLVPQLKAEVTFYAVFIGGGWSQLLCFSAWRVILSYGCSYLIVWRVGEFEFLFFTPHWYVHLTKFSFTVLLVQRTIGRISCTGTKQWCFLDIDLQLQFANFGIGR